MTTDSPQSALKWSWNFFASTVESPLATWLLALGFQRTRSAVTCENWRAKGYVSASMVEPSVLA